MAQMPPGALPVPALQLDAGLRYSQLLEIEQMAQHVVRNTVAFSKAVWQSLSPEERAIMLEGFTIGTPIDGIADESQSVPLLNCVENPRARILWQLDDHAVRRPAAGRRRDGHHVGQQIQDTLAEFHRKGFPPPVSMVALPTRGVLGEAVLGSCSSAEKIDLTRFWNWTDSPSDEAPKIEQVSVPTTSGSIATGLNAPSQLTSLQPFINNRINANPSAGSDGALLQIRR